MPNFYSYLLWKFVLMKLFTTILFAVFFSFVSLAQTSTWTGMASSAWDNPANWDGGVPSLTTTVSIFSSPNNPVISSNAYAQQVIVSPGASLTITLNAILEIDKSASTDMLPGLLINTNVENNGVININNAYNGILLNSTGTLENYGDINIGLTGSISSQGLYNDGIVINDNSATISIDDVSVGIVNFFGDFTNYGQIKIGETVGITLDGIGNYSTMNNYGDIEIFDAARTALRTYNSDPFYGTFINHQDAFVEIGIAQRGIRNEGTLTNFGEMIVGDIGSISFFAIDNRVDGILENKQCANLICNFKLENTSSNSIENDGLFIFSSPAGSNIGLFNNNGIINDLNNSFFSVPSSGYVENGFFVSSSAATFNSCSIPAIYSLPVSGNYVVEGVYLNMAATTPASNYDPVTASFNFPNVGVYNFFIRYEDLGSNCSIILPWSINVSFVGSTITFTGNGDGIDWHDPMNWDLGIVPEVCHHVIIPATQNVIILPNALGVGRTLCVNLNASLDVPDTAELEIIPY